MESTTACDGTTIDPGDFMMYFLNSYPVGYIQQQLPADGDVVVVKWGSAYTSSKGNPKVYLEVGGDNIASTLSSCSWKQGEMQTTAVSYDEGDVLRLDEGRGVMLIWSVDICSPSEYPTPAPTTEYPCSTLIFAGSYDGANSEAMGYYTLAGEVCEW